MKHHNTFSCSLNYHESGEVVKPFAKKTNHVDMQSNKRLSAFSIAKRVAVHGINELADVVFPKLANSFHFLLVDTMALAPSQTFPQQPSL